MNTRCNNPNTKQYKDYGGRGIKNTFKTFESFLAALPPKPDKNYTVDRIDNNGNYEVGNIKWSTKKQQGENKRKYTTNTTAIVGICVLKPTGKYKTLRFLARTSGQDRKDLYKGPDFFLACCARKSWECLK